MTTSRLTSPPLVIVIGNRRLYYYYHYYIGSSRVAGDERESSFGQPARRDYVGDGRQPVSSIRICWTRTQWGPRDEWPRRGGVHRHRQPGRTRAPHNPSLASTVHTQTTPLPRPDDDTRARVQCKHNNNIIMCFFNYYFVGEPYTILRTKTGFGMGEKFGISSH